MKNKVFAGLALIFILIFSACENPFFPDAIFKGGISVSINPEASYVFMGDAIQFSAAVKNSKNQSVIWSIAGNGLHNDTIINEEGLLKVSQNQAAGAKINVIAVSSSDSSKRGELIITVIGEDEFSELISITGENKAGETLTVDTSKVEDGEGEFTYKWIVDGEEVEGENEKSYTITEEDEGKEISCEVTYTTDEGNKITVVITIPGKTIYSIVIDFRDDEEGDTVTANPIKGIEGKEITLSYTVINNGKINNRLVFGGVDGIDTVTSAGSGTRTYIVNPDDSINDVITIMATFTHTDLIIDEISFTDESSIIHKTYGDTFFTNSIKTGHTGTGAITYSSENEDVATVNNSGVVTIKKAGGTVITAQKAADAVYAHASASYTLNVEHKTITITGVTAIDRDYIGGNTTVTLTGGALVGVINSDNVGFTLGNGTMANANIGNNKPVTTAITLTGYDAENYTLTQPVVTVNITKSAILEKILEEITASMILVQSGRFLMGQNGDGSSGNETSVHTVTLTPSFSMSKYQVTQEQYMAVMGNNPSYFHGGTGREPAAGEIQGKRPVESVSWYGAIVFCNSLSILAGLTPAYSINGSTNPDVWGTVPTDSNATWDAVIIVAGSTGYRLPTEAQWEYAAKGGSLSQRFIYAGSNNVGEVAWYSSNSNSRTHQVGLKKPNELGLYDMSGNVTEFCWDWYGNYTATAKTNPMGASSGSSRVVRGGIHGGSATNTRSVNRGSSGPGFRSGSYGFRLVRP